MKKLNTFIDCVSILIICFCLFAEYQKDEWNQHNEEGLKLEKTIYYKISTSEVSSFIKSVNTFFVKNADANYHPREIFMDLPTAIMFIVLLSVGIRREFG